MHTGLGLDVTSNPDGLAFTTDGLKLAGAMPDVLTLFGPDEVPVEFRPSDLCPATRGRRQSPLGRATTQTWRWEGPRDGVLTWTLSQIEHVPAFTLQAAFYNGGDQPVRLREFGVCRTREGGLFPGGDPDRWAWNGLDLATIAPSFNERTREIWDGFGIPLPFDLQDDEKSTDGRWRTSSEFVTVYTDGGDHGLTIGAVGTEANVRIDGHVDRGGIRLEVVSEMTDVVVEPGEWRRSEEVLVYVAPYETALGALFRWVAATHGHRTHRGPLFGWCSWYDLAGKITGEHVEAVADAVNDLRDRIPMDVIQIDAGFQRQVGDWALNEKFPHGWAPIVEKIRQAGAVPGLWLEPLGVDPSLGLHEQHPDWFVRDADGKLPTAIGDGGVSNYWLDPTQPEAREFLRHVIRGARDAGFEYYKIDFNEVGGMARYPRFHDRRKTRLQAYRDLYRLYREEVGEAAYLMACAGANRGVFGYADAARIGPDSTPTWHAAHPCCIRDCLREVGQFAAVNGVLLAADPDVTYAKPRKNLTADELQTWHSFVGLLGGLAMVSEPLQQPAYQEDAVLRAIEVLQPPAPDRGRSFRGGVDREHRQFGFVADRPWGTFASVLLYNPDDQPADQTLWAGSLGGWNGRYHVWSFWDQRYLGINDGDLVASQLPAHGSVLLRLTPEPASAEIPLLVGSDLHIGMGSAEIAAIAATKTGMTIELTDAGARSGTLFIASAVHVALDRAQGVGNATVAQIEDRLWAVSLDGRRRGTDQVIRLRIDAER